MGELINIFISLVKGAPTESTMILASFALFMTMWLKSREVDVTTATSIGKLQQDHMKALMDQNRQLADDLASLRDKMAEQYNKMEELRQKISDLEEVVRNYENKHP